MTDPFAAFKSHAVAQPSPKLSPLKRKGERAISTQELDAALARAGQAAEGAGQPDAPRRPREIGGPSGPEPTRYGDWEVGGIASDF